MHLSYQISFSKQVRLLLGRPRHMDFWWGRDEKLLLVSAAKSPTSSSAKLTSCGYARICNRKLRDTIQDLTGFGDNPNVVFYGDYVPELGMVAFRTGAERMGVLMDA
jgi:hypothetical protein